MQGSLYPWVTAVAVVVCLSVSRPAVAVAPDWGDAPSPYPTLAATNGASHAISPGVCLGSTIDGEPNGQPTPGASGDDTTGVIDDEDGVTFNTFLQPGKSASVTVVASVPGSLYAWVDFGRDGSWDPADQIAAAVPVASGPNLLSFAVPAAAQVGTTYARFRFTTLPQPLGPTGGAQDGEVEDYCVSIESNELPANKMHYPQLPDPFGWDVKATPPNILADDFRCATNGRITEITFWGSWFEDVIGVINNVHLSIHSDDRSGPFSRPGKLLWTTNVTDMTVTPEEPSVQGWFDPVQHMVMLRNHQMYFKYVVNIPASSAFEQTAGTIYWLDIQVNAMDGFWGWKTSRSPHFEDDAVYGPGQLEWNELIDPVSDLSLDMAFIINEKPEPLIDFGDAPEPVYRTTLATNGARHVIAGPWLGPPADAPDAEPNGQPHIHAKGDNVAGSDDENGVTFPRFVRGATSAISFEVNNVTGGGGVVEIWLDLDGDGTWQAGELVVNGFYPNGVHTVSVAIPRTAIIGATFARCRVSTQGTGSPLGLALTGEVEDYEVFIDPWPRCAKWEQPPDCAIGVDLRSYLAPQQPGFRVADDWLCDGRPITHVRWWGSYIGNNLPPEPPPLGSRPIGFRLMWFEDIPADKSETGHSMPGKLLTNVFVRLESYGATEPQPGCVVERYACTSTLGWMLPALPPPPFEHEYEYTCELPAAWNEKEGTIYWLAVEAQYAEAIPIFPWGWKTTHPENNWNDDAVVLPLGPGGGGMGPWQELTYPPALPPWNSVTNWPYAGQSVNMAFALLTDVCQRRGKKWSQPPDLWRGMDLRSCAPSNAIWSNPWPVRADDFVSDGRRITDLHWWGSYIGWQSETNGIVPPPSNPADALLGFQIGWHTDIPAGGVGGAFSRPNQPPLVSVFVPAGKCHEVYYGVVTQTWGKIAFEHEFQYYVDLLDPEINRPWYETNGVVYWLSIQAVFPARWVPGGGGSQGSHSGWGWLSTHPSNQWNDVSVVATNYVLGSPQWFPAEFPVDHPWWLEGKHPDLAFELTTDEVKTNRWGTTIVITNIQAVGTTVVHVASVGDIGAGVQVLQSRTNLLTNAWVNVTTNPLPLPRPYTNNWYRAVPGVSNEYYRILQK